MELTPRTVEVTEELIELFQRMNAKADRIMFLLTTDEITPLVTNGGHPSMPQPGEE